MYSILSSLEDAVVSGCMGLMPFPCRPGSLPLWSRSAWVTVFWKHMGAVLEPTLETVGLRFRMVLPDLAFCLGQTEVDSPQR